MSHRISVQNVWKMRCGGLGRLWAVALLVTGVLGGTSTAGITDLFGKKTPPTDPFIGIGASDPTIMESPRSADESLVLPTVVDLTPPWVASPATPLEIVPTDRFGNTPTSPASLYGGTLLPELAPPDVPESLRLLPGLRPTRGSATAVADADASNERFRGDPLSPTRVGRSPYGSSSNYEADTRSQTAAKRGLFSNPFSSDSAEPDAALHSDVVSGSGLAMADGTDTLSDEELLKGFNPAVEYADTWTRFSWLWKGKPDESKALTEFEKAKTLYREKKYTEAAKQFAEAGAHWPESALQEDSLFMRAESLFFADRYDDAYKAYCELFKYYEFSRYTDVVSRRMFLIAQYWERYSRQHPRPFLIPNFIDPKRPMFDTRGNAIKCYESVRMYDPLGPFADSSLMASAGVYFEDEKWCDAARQYNLLRKEYTKSEFQQRASVLEIQALCNQYQGEMYEVTPMRDAGKLIDQTLIRFGDQLGEERLSLLETRQDVVEKLARREFSIGKYYDTKGYYRAARIYYESVILEFPDTASAIESKQRLTEICDYQDEPTDYLAWVENIFPQRRR